MMKQLVKIFLTLIAVAGSITIRAQHVNLSNFYLIPNDKEVLMYWTIDSGPTCNGITVWHSTDSLNYEEIGNIGGVCGGSSSATPYNFTHDSPILNSINYYKLRLGYAQFSEIKTITIKYTQPGKLYVYPNPTSDQTIIEFNNDHLDRYSVFISDNLGNVVHKKEGVTEGRVQVNTTVWNSGTYFITVTDNGGRVLKEKLVITK